MSLKTISRGNSVVELILIILLAIGLWFVIQAFIVKPYVIPSGSMLPTLAIGQRVLVNRLGHDFSDPHVGEIVVFHPPQGATPPTACGVHVASGQICPQPTTGEAGVNFIKRVVAGPGETISIQKDGHVLRNGVLQKEPFIAPCPVDTPCGYPKPITVPAGHWFMMGDNRGDSEDSRFWGPVPTKWIIGGAVATYWPVGRIGLL